jgi:TldD protein
MMSFPFRFPALTVLAFVAPLVTYSQQLSKPDPTLAAMQAELTREQAGLQLPGMEKPYFIEYRLDDIVSYEALANFGALTREENTRQRIVRVTVRIGSYAADNSSARGEGSVGLAPTDENPQALQYALWIATDEAYKNALRQLSAKQAALKHFEGQSPVHDFAEARPVTNVEPLRNIEIDRGEWKRRIVEASGAYRTDAAVNRFAGDVQYSTANLRAVALNRFLVNSEGTRLLTGYTGYAANVSVGGQADDGMRLGRDNGSVAARADELESAAAFHQRVIDDLKSFNELRAAPLVSAEDYHGPVLFSGDASADVLNRLFVPNVEGDRPDLGTAARTQGAYTSSLHARVLPALLSATDNPLTAMFAGKHLVGAYKVDDEGVPADPTDVVIAGKLQNFLIGREPIRDFTTSNGHGRAAAGQPARSRSGVMLFKPASGADGKTLSDAEMRDHLLALAREQKRDVYAVETLADLAPRMLFLTHPDGSRQLVRGAVFDELDNRSLRSSITAAGGTPYVNNTLAPIPQTTIVPQLLFDDIGVKRANEEQQKLPYYPPPPTNEN